ncbi:ketopantoate reductase [Fontimonas thermophila]|uniref:2-dehydropantoate 2-reductase n=1 Tax=Fontimonas thermophila TaxID=1076937 RepID=A0A1I2IE61_9GAMM|nr:ketopantoate reductase C-terminal domain-containing protein [Fontimonas thermophila]SFF40639.1 ketopantoate reductase [Fontimonas thermophila]
MILVVGAGAVGTILTAYLGVAQREPVKLYVRDKDLAKLQTVQDVRVEHAGAQSPPIIAPKPVLTRSLSLDGVDYLLLCVKFPHLDGLLNELACIPPGCTIVSTLNGVSALRRIRERFPHARVVPMTVMFNAQLLEPLHARITTRPHVLIGSDDARLLGAFAGSGMDVRRAAGESAAWGKLLINLANAICALTHTTFKDLLTHPDLRAIYVAALDEAVHLLDAARIEYKLPMPIPYRIYRALLAGRSPLPWWFAKLRNGLQEGSYPSMVADIESGRPTEIDQLNGEIVSLGREHGIATPVNARIVASIRAIEGVVPAPYLTPSDLRASLGV